MSAPTKTPLLALDTASPVPSVALRRIDGVIGHRVTPPRACSASLLALVDELLAEADLEITALRGVVVLRGPGSFTGLRVGMATALGLHLALGIPVASPSTFEVLAAAAFGASGCNRCLAAVDALRGSWLVAVSSRGEPARFEEPPSRLGPEQVADVIERLEVDSISGFGSTGLAATIGFTGHVVEPEALAPAAAAQATSFADTTWDPEALRRPLYLHAPAVTASPKA